MHEGHHRESKRLIRSTTSLKNGQQRQLQAPPLGGRGTSLIEEEGEVLDPEVPVVLRTG